MMVTMMTIHVCSLTMVTTHSASRSGQGVSWPSWERGKGRKRRQSQKSSFVRPRVKHEMETCRRSVTVSLLILSSLHLLQSFPQFKTPFSFVRQKQTLFVWERRKTQRRTDTIFSLCGKSFRTQKLSVLETCKSAKDPRQWSMSCELSLLELLQTFRWNFRSHCALHEH